MSSSTSNTGAIAWHDLTVPNADAVRDFYQGVAGWKVEPVEMEGYNDYSMVSAATGETVAGVCHARGSNADLPPQWMIYITVADLDQAIADTQRLGGTLVSRRGDSMALIQDPAGAHAMLYQV